jgi:nitrile hydratase accessory protein
VSTPTDILGADATGPAALPRRNGELVFDAPWESRAFGAALAMSQSGIYQFDELRDLLIEEIGHWERTHGSDGDGWSYYAHWLMALERLLAQRNLLGPDEIEERIRTIARHQQDEHGHAHD